MRVAQRAAGLGRRSAPGRGALFAARPSGRTCERGFSVALDHEHSARLHREFHQDVVRGSAGRQSRRRRHRAGDRVACRLSHTRLDASFGATTRQTSLHAIRTDAMVIDWAASSSAFTSDGLKGPPASQWQRVFSIEQRIVPMGAHSPPDRPRRPPLGAIENEPAATAAPVATDSSPATRLLRELFVRAPRVTNS